MDFNNIFSKKSCYNYSQETICILRLLRSENVGPRTYFELIRLFGNAKTALQHIKDFAIKGGRRKPIKICTLQDVEKEIEALNKVGAYVITHNDPQYPRLLLQISDPPPIITCKGNANLLNNKIIAVVGSRNASLNAITFTKKITQDLSNKGFTIVSGLARGIDTAAHASSLPQTIAVIAGGINHIYPQENTNLYHKIAENGLVIAELPIHAVPISKNFPQRNRIIAGIALGTLVVEANLKSGSLITARFTHEYNRELFAVPGFPYDPRCQGTNKLIKEGEAHLAENAEDILTQITDVYINKNNCAEHITEKYQEIESYQAIHVNDDCRAQIRNYLSSSPISISDIIEATKLPIGFISVIILELELAGKIMRYPGDKISILYDNDYNKQNLGLPI